MKTLNLNLRRILRETKEPGILLKDNLLTTLNSLKDKISAIAEEDGDAFFSALDGAGLKKSGDSLFQSAVVDESETKKAQERWTALGGGGSSSSEPKPSPAAAPASSAPEKKGADGADPKPAEAPKPSSPSKAEPTAPSSTPSSKGGDTNPFSGFGAPSSGSEPGGKKGTDAPSATPSNPGGFGGGAPASEPKAADPKPSGTDAKPAGGGDAGNKSKPAGGGDIGQQLAEIWNGVYQKIGNGERVTIDLARDQARTLAGVELEEDDGFVLVRTKESVYLLPAQRIPGVSSQNLNLAYHVTERNNPETSIVSVASATLKELGSGKISGQQIAKAGHFKKGQIFIPTKDAKPKANSEKPSTSNRDDKGSEAPSSSNSSMGGFAGYNPPSRGGGDQKRNESDNKGKSGGGGDIGQQIAEIMNKEYEKGQDRKPVSAIESIKGLPGVESVEKQNPWALIKTNNTLFLVPYLNSPSSSTSFLPHSYHLNERNNPVYHIDLVASTKLEAFGDGKIDVETAVASRGFTKGKMYIPTA